MESQPEPTSAPVHDSQPYCKLQLRQYCPHPGKSQTLKLTLAIPSDVIVHEGGMSQAAVCDTSREVLGVLPVICEGVNLERAVSIEVCGIVSQVLEQEEALRALRALDEGRGQGGQGGCSIGAAYK